MALASCPGCGEELQGRSEFCPACGRPLRVFQPNGEIICPNQDCDYSGPPEKEGGYYAGCFLICAIAMGAFLLPFFGHILGPAIFFIAIVYFFAGSGPRYSCPKCKTELERD